MIEALIRRFVPHHENHADKKVRRAYGMLVSVVGIILNLLLAVGKLLTGIFSGLVSIQADAVNNLSDAGYCIVTLVSFRIAAKPADRDHPYGHARMEYVSGMAVSFLILLVGFELLKSAGLSLYHSIFTPEHMTKAVFSPIMALVLVASILAKLWLCFLNKKIGKRIDSPTMRATAADSLSDAAATTAVLIATLVYRFTGFDPDAYMGILVALFILWAGIKILGETKNSILGERPSEELVAEIKTVVEDFRDAGVIGLHDLAVHNYGPGRIMASLHVEVDGDMDIYKSHDVIDRIERRLRMECGMIATVHMDPVAVRDPAVAALREIAEAEARAIDPRLTLHDFRIVPGDTHTNLIFDVVLPSGIGLSEKELRQRIDKVVKKIDPTYYTVITFDNDFTGR